MKHVAYECPKPCESPYCAYCEGGLFLCVKCDCAEGTLPSECPGSPVPYCDQQKVYAGELDYRAGSWVPMPSGSRSSHYDGRPGLPAPASKGVPHV